MSWCTIESDPGVFTELIEKMGVQDVAVTEVYDFSMMDEQQKGDNCHGFIYLFNYNRETAGSTDDRVLEQPPEGMFFARQVVQDACATQAILSVLMNAPCVQLGDMLGDFKGFASVLDSESMGITIGNHDGIRSAHNAFAQPEPFVAEENQNKNGKTKETFHFVAFLPYQGNMYCIDGLRKGPVFLGPILSDWSSDIQQHIQAKMQQANDIKSVLLAVGKSRLSDLRQQLAAADSAAASATATDASEAADARANLLLQLEDEMAAKAAQKRENILRRHNFFPAVLLIAQSLAAKGQLLPMLETAREKKRARVAATEATGTAAAKGTV